MARYLQQIAAYCDQGEGWHFLVEEFDRDKAACLHRGARLKSF